MLEQDNEKVESFLNLVNTKCETLCELKDHYMVLNYARMQLASFLHIGSYFNKIHDILVVSIEENIEYQNQIKSDLQ